MRCNLFKPLACKTGEFLTFAQYTDDVTKEQSGKTTYMVIPSKFAVLDVDLSKVFTIQDTLESRASKFVKASRSTTYTSSPEDSLCVFAGSNHEVKGYNNIISQIFQSAYENAVALLRDENPDLFTDDSHEYSRYILWSILEDARFLNPTTETISGETTTYWPELKYVGDINFNSDRDIDNYNYNEIYCHIPAEQKDKIYAIAQLQFAPRNIPENPLNYTTWLDGWNENTYPQNYPLKGYALPPVDTPTPGSMFEGYYEVRPYDLRMFSPIESPGASFIDNDGSEQFKFNTIILFYDVYDMTDGTDVRVLHRNRPMGIYFTGPVAPMDNGYPRDFLNSVTKYISNEDAYGQGASFGLRLMTRLVPTPNSSSYEIAVSTGDNVDEYNIIATSLGRINDAIKDSNESFRSMQEMAQQYKDHLANFENNRTNVPYPREVGGVYYWFVNGRNTGQRCTTEGLNPVEIHDTTPNWNETGNVELILNHGEQTGWAYVEKEDINPYSATYGMLRKFREYNEEMWGPTPPIPGTWEPTVYDMNHRTDNPGEDVSHQFNRVVRPYYEDDLLNPIYLSSGYFEFMQTDENPESPTYQHVQQANGFNINWQNYTPQGVFVPGQVPSGPINWEEGQKSTIAIDEIEPNTSVLVVDAYGRRTGEVISKWHDINPYSPTYDKEWDVHTFDSTQYQPRLFPFDIVCPYISDTNKQQIAVYRETDNTLIWSNALLNDVEIADYNYVQGVADNLVSLSLQYGELIAILVKPGENYHFNNIVLNDEISDPSYNFNDEHFGECRKVRMSIQNDNRMRISIESGGAPTPQPTLDPPTITPQGGTSLMHLNIEISGDPEATIRFTTDGSDPNENSPIWNPDVEFIADRNMVVKAKAWKPGYNPSEVALQEYIIGFSRIPSHNQVNANDNYMIVDVASNTALTYAQGTSGSPVAVPVNITHDNISGNIPTELFWKFEPVTGGYKIHPANDPSKYLYCTNSNTGVRVGNTNNTWSVDIRDDNSDYHGISNENGRYIGVYFSNDEPKDWRGYTSIGSNIRDTQIEFFVLGRVPAEIPENPVFETEQNRYYEYVDVELSCETQGASIYYTTDGSTPTAESILYDGPIHITQSATINAIAINDIYTSEVISASYIITNIPLVATPQITPNSGYHNDIIEVTITSETSGATIYYTTDGSTPTSESLIYTEPIEVQYSMVITAVAIKSGMADSWVNSVEYSLPFFASDLDGIYDALNVQVVAPGSICKVTGDVVFVFRSGKYIYVKDDSAGMLLYDDNNIITTEYVEGDVISGGVTGMIRIYNEQIELIPTMNTAESTENVGNIEPDRVNVTTISGTEPGEELDGLLSQLVTIYSSEVHMYTPDDPITSNAFIINDDEGNSMTIYDGFNTIDESLIPTPHVAVEVSGFLNRRNNSYRILPRTQQDIYVY